MEKATFIQRFVAYIIDVIIVAIVFGLVSGLGSQLSDTLITKLEGEAAMFSVIGVPLAAQLLNLAFAVVYYGYFWATRGQTPGQMVMKVKVIRTDGSTLTWDGAILRYIGYILSSLFGWLGFLWALWDKDKQGWPDKLAGTYVMKA